MFGHYLVEKSLIVSGAFIRYQIYTDKFSVIKRWSGYFDFMTGRWVGCFFFTGW